MKVLALVMLVACQSSDVSRELGAECSTDKDCDHSCAMAPAWPDGMCTIGCKTDADCPDSAACSVQLGNVCAYRCTTDNECAFLGMAWGCTTPVGEVAVCFGK